MLPIVATGIIFLSATASSAQAYSVQVTPTRPVLGDTLSVKIQGLKQRSYPNGHR